MSLPFGFKTPSRGTLIFSGLAGAISGLVYTSNKHSEESRTKLAQRVSFLADRPCGVNETPRKVLVYISAPPGDSLEKSRNWFREYVKPILVAGAIDYEVKEAKSEGQIESSVMQDIVQLRRQSTQQRKRDEPETSTTPQHTGPYSMLVNTTPKITTRKPFPSPVLKKKLQEEKEEHHPDYDGILAIGRNAYREVLSGLSKGCDADPNKIEKTETVSEEVSPEQPKEDQQLEKNTVTVDQIEQEDSVDHFSLPSKFSPIMYIPHVNIIGWSNIPYRLYMWYADYKRIEDVGSYVVAAVLNQTRPMTKEDADKGNEERIYWIGDEEVEEKAKNDPPIVIDDRIIDNLSTYTTSTE
ncbi:Mitochondrial import inner membrane translocase subunit TIM54 [Choanephora cucurbitarum]|uniref:Mitochondrial import inner membrane translocase subunit TIM54 n=1 Tax=Choanephora cucurbitarum TaxID=101091 RepID=A0A1C7NAR7_9FUNG|nr:Mitochondrial import inner membrane translocase subunit TIM54 [Choanephora cucurbitarum]